MPQRPRTRGNGLTHLDARNRPTMVDVGAKSATRRSAEAEAIVRLPVAVARALKASGHRTRKGPVFDTAIIAGVMAVKRTAEHHSVLPSAADRALQHRHRGARCRRSCASAAASRPITRPASKWRRSPAPRSRRSPCTTCARRCRTTIRIGGVRLLSKSGGKREVRGGRELRRAPVERRGRRW